MNKLILIIISMIYLNAITVDTMINSAKYGIQHSDLDFKLKSSLIKNINKNKLNISKKVPTFFYLYSTSIPKSALINYFNLINKLKIKLNQDIVGYGVLIGMTPARVFKRFLRTFRYKDEFNIKILPNLYNKFNVSTVPAILFSYCQPKKYFRFKSCDNKFIVRGDITLRKFISLMAKEDKKFDKYYEALAF